MVLFSEVMLFFDGVVFPLRKMQNMLYLFTWIGSLQIFNMQIYMFKINLCLGHILNKVLKFWKFQPQYSYKVYSSIKRKKGVSNYVEFKV